MQKNILLLITLLVFNTIVFNTKGYQVNITQKQLDAEKIEANIEFILAPEELLQKNSLKITATSSTVEVTPPITESATILKYDNNLKENIQAYEKNVIFNFILDKVHSETEIYITFKINNLPTIQEKFFIIKQIPFIKKSNIETQKEKKRNKENLYEKVFAVAVCFLERPGRLRPRYWYELSSAGYFLFQYGFWRYP